MKRILLASSFLVLAAGPAAAVETGFSIYPKGMADFMSGIPAVTEATILP